MPIYEYICLSCQHAHEALQKISDAPLTICPSCQKASLQKMISAPSFRLKGGGWYETDFKSNNQKNLATPDTEAPSCASSSSNGDGGTGACSDKTSS